MIAQASGADRWRRDNGAEWKRQELAESGSSAVAVCDFKLKPPLTSPRPGMRFHAVFRPFLKFEIKFKKVVDVFEK
jgi:hypothetical protein